MALLAGLGGADLRVALGLRLGDGGVAHLLLDVAGRHGLHDHVIVGEVLDGDVDNLKAHVAHVGRGRLGGLRRELVAVLHKVRDGHAADDLAHVALEHLRGDGRDVGGLPAQELLGGGCDGHVIRAKLDVGDAVHHDGDVFLRGNGLRGADVHLHDAHVQLIHPFKEGDDERRAAAHDAVTEPLDHFAPVLILDPVLPAPA